MPDVVVEPVLEDGLPDDDEGPLPDEPEPDVELDDDDVPPEVEVDDPEVPDGPVPPGTFSH